MAACIRLAIVAALGLMSAPVAANPLKSALTTIELKACRPARAPGGFAGWTCRGLPGYPVRIAHAGQRTFVSIGPHAERRRSASQSLNVANTIFPRGKTRATLEWRVDRIGTRLVPYATILRSYTQAGGRTGEVIVVLRVDPQDSCVVAYIDATGEANAIALARSIADRAARAFTCSSDPETFGARGRSPM